MKRASVRRLFTALEVVLFSIGAALLGAYLMVYFDRGIYQNSKERAFDRQLENERASLPDARALTPGSLIGRIEIPGAEVRAMIVHGTGDRLLRRAVGHIEGTALPGEPGNVGLAGHRDTFFRGLSHVRKGDRITLRTLEGSFEYEVDMLRIVGPADIEVLNASSTPTLTLVTCYPFEYVGSAPRRFIVHARQVSGPGAMPSPVPGS
jgi:sortase A